MSTPFGPHSEPGFDHPGPSTSTGVGQDQPPPSPGVIAPEMGTVGAEPTPPRTFGQTRSRVDDATPAVKRSLIQARDTARTAVAGLGSTLPHLVRSVTGGTAPSDAEARRTRPAEEPQARGGGGRRKRQREEIMVPPAEFSSYYGRNIVKPAPWKHEIPAYLYMGGLAAGSALVAAGGEFTGRHELQRNSRLIALAALVGSTGALIADLGKPSRFLNMMRTVKLTSPMSVGSWILAGFGAFTGTAAVSEVMRFVVPKDVPGQQFWPIGDRLASLGAGAFSAPLAAYTAVLLSDTATPTWHASYKQLPFVFVGSALAAAGGAAMTCTDPVECGPARRLAVGGSVLELAAFQIMQRELGMLAEPLHEGKAGRYLTTAKALTIGGATLAALSGHRRSTAILAGLALNVGSALTRFGVFEAGMTSARDPKYTVVPQRERLEKRLEQRRLGEPPERSEQDQRVAHHSGMAVNPF